MSLVLSWYAPCGQLNSRMMKQSSLEPIRQSVCSSMWEFSCAGTRRGWTCEVTDITNMVSKTNKCCRKFYIQNHVYTPILTCFFPYDWFFPRKSRVYPTASWYVFAHIVPTMHATRSLFCTLFETKEWPENLKLLTPFFYTCQGRWYWRRGVADLKETKGCTGLESADGARLMD